MFFAFYLFCPFLRGLGQPRLAIFASPALSKPDIPGNAPSANKYSTKLFATIQRTFHLAFGLPLCKRLPLVVQLFTASKPEIDLRPAILQEEPYRNQRIAPCVNFAANVVNLAPVQQQFPWAQRIVIEILRRLTIRRNVHAYQPDLAVVDPCVGFPDVHLAIPDRLDLGPAKLDAGFEQLVDVEVVIRLAIDDHDLLSGTPVARS